MFEMTPVNDKNSIHSLLAWIKSPTVIQTVTRLTYPCCRNFDIPSNTTCHIYDIRLVTLLAYLTRKGL